eukprot:scaffold242052_cov26-Cyclotella_meneghiniana.AAC.1
MDSTLKWNTTCGAYATYDELVAAAKIIEQSVIDMINLPGDNTLNLVHVYKLCNTTIDHGGTPVIKKSRRLQVAVVTTDINMYQIVSKQCNTDSSQEMFDDANNALKEIVDNGSLTKSIQSNSQGVIKAMINPNSEAVDSVFVTMTASPTVTPGSPSSSPSSKPSRTPITLPPITDSPVVLAPPTASPVSLDSPTRKPTSRPTAAKSGKKSAKSAKSSKSSVPTAPPL